MSTSSQSELVEELKTFENEGLKLQYKVEQLLLEKGSDPKPFDLYEIWKINLLHFAEMSKDRDFELAIKKPDSVKSFLPYLIFKEQISQGLQRTYLSMDEEMTDLRPDEEILRQIEAMKVGILSRLEALAALRRKFSDSVENNIEIHITYNFDLGKFNFNDTDSVVVEGKQKDVADYLVEQGMNAKASWDAIHERFKDSLNPSRPTKEQILIRKKSVRTAVSQINKKTEKSLEKDKELISGKNNEYWLQYEVDKDR
ncbi:hypothetical protein BH11PAT2_BH11PAT2_04910 [soil metagenome]